MHRYLKKIASLWYGRRSERDHQTPLLGLDIPFSADTGIDQGTEPDIARRLAAMPVFVRETYLLRTVDRMSIEQIAYRLAISQREVRRNLRRAIAFLLH